MLLLHIVRAIFPYSPMVVGGEDGFAVVEAAEADDSNAFPRINNVTVEVTEVELTSTTSNEECERITSSAGRLPTARR